MENKQLPADDDDHDLITYRIAQTNANALASMLCKLKFWKNSAAHC